MSALEAAGGAGVGLGAIGSFFQGSSQSAAASYNAQIDRTNAAMALQQSQTQAYQQQIKNEQALGAERADYGASGITLEGSAMNVLHSNAQQGELARQTILYNGQAQAWSLNRQADLQKIQSGYDMFGGGLGAVAKTLSGGAGLASTFGTGNSLTQRSGGDYSNFDVGNMSYTGSLGAY